MSDRDQVGVEPSLASYCAGRSIRVFLTDTAAAAAAAAVGLHTGLDFLARLRVAGGGKSRTPLAGRSVVFGRNFRGALTPLASSVPVPAATAGDRRQLIQLGEGIGLFPLFRARRKLGLGGRRQHGIRERAGQRRGSIAVMAGHGDGATGAAASRVPPSPKAKDVLALHAGGEALKSS